MLKSKNICYLSLIFFITCFTSCGSGNGIIPSNTDSMAISVSDASGITSSLYTEGSYTTSSAGFSYLDPNLVANVTANSTVIELLSGDLNNRTMLLIDVNGNTPQTYKIDPGSQSFLSYDINGQTYATFFCKTPRAQLL